MMHVAAASADSPEGLKLPPTPPSPRRRRCSRTLGIPIVRGRAFTDRDTEGAPVVILSELAARTFFQSVDAVGRSLVMRRGSTEFDRRGRRRRPRHRRAFRLHRPPSIDLPAARATGRRRHHADRAIERQRGGRGGGVARGDSQGRSRSRRRCDRYRPRDADRSLRAAPFARHRHALSRRLHVAALDGRPVRRAVAHRRRIARARSACACRWAPPRGRSS